MLKIKGLLLAFILVVSVSNVRAGDVVTKKLPVPEFKANQELYKLFKERKSVKEFSDKAIDDVTLSEILWSAWGFSHDDKRTIPTAKDIQNMSLYVVKADGVWLYDAKDVELKQVVKDDLRSLFTWQGYVKDAPVILVYVGDRAKDDHHYSEMHAGSMYQNVALYCVSKGLNNVVRGYFDVEAFAGKIGTSKDAVIVSQAIGWAK